MIRVTQHQVDSAKLVQVIRDNNVLIAAQRRAQAWARLKLYGWLALFMAAWMLFLVWASYAGGMATVTWNQSQDCGLIAGWDLLSAPITTSQPNPTVAQAAVAGQITNGPPVVCGPSATSNVSVFGVGNTRFWLRAVSTGSPATTSVSNSVDVSLPLTKPLGLGIVVP